MTPTRAATVARRPRAGTSGGRAHAPASGRVGVRLGGRSVAVSTLLTVDVLLLCLVGLVMVGSASSVVSIATYGTPWAIFLREVMWMAIGGAALYCAVRLDYRRLRRLAPLLLLLTFGLLFVVLVPGLGVHAMGSSRWIGFGQLRLQPSELMKLALTLFAADFIAKRLDEDASDRRIIGPLLIVTGFACVLILAQPDMGTAMVLGFIALALLFVSGVSLGPVMKVMAALAGLAVIVAVASPYRRARLLSFVNPSAHGSGSGYQVMQSLIGLGSGHLVGAGIGGGQAQWGFLPNAHTDFIFSVIGEQLGIVGALATLVLLAGLLWLGIRTATQSPDRFGALLAIGLVAWVAAETLINVGAVVGVLPVTGIPLPFISFGGSSLVITMAAAGILVNIARQGEAVGARTPARPRRRPRTARRAAGSAAGSVRARRVTVIAGGGTGGHIVPSLQIARALVDRGHAPETIHLFGSRRGQEATTWPALEFPYTLLTGRGVRRSLAPSAWAANAGAVLGLLWACLRAVASFVARRPRAVVIVGGYASLPAGVAAVVTRVPLVSMTTDAVPGAVNGLLGRFAAANAVAFAGTGLPRAHVTGTPVRAELHALDLSSGARSRSRAELGLPVDRQTVASVGGSLGARRINRAVADLADLWSTRGDRALYHVTGRRDFEAFAPRDGDGRGLAYRVVPFEERMLDLYRAADVCVTRAGAMTVAELLVTGVPAILVPLPGAPRDHQTKNAQALVAAGVAVHVPDAECDGRRLARELDELLSDPVRLAAMRDAARGQARPDAAARVAELVDAHAH